MAKRRASAGSRIFKKAKRTLWVLVAGASLSAGAQQLLVASPSSVVPAALMMAASGDLKGAYSKVKKPAQRAIRGYLLELSKSPELRAAKAAVP